MPARRAGQFAAGPTCEAAKPVFDSVEFYARAVLHEGPMYLAAGMPGIAASKDGLHFSRPLWATAPLP